MAANRVKMEPSVGKRILALLKRQGYRVSDVAKKTGYTREYFSRLLNSGDVDDLIVWKISNAIGVDIANILEPKPDECHEKVASLEK